MNTEQLVKKCESKTLLNPREALCVLDPDLPRQALQRILKSANARMHDISEERGRIWTAIGIDAAPCSRNCRFCSLGAKWGIFNDKYELTAEEICNLIPDMLTDRPDWITLRTSQNYGIAKLCKIVKKLKQVLSMVNTKIVANTGEFDRAEAHRLYSAGVDTVYHTLRLREGIDTGVSVQERLHTLKVIRDSELELAALVEPVGPEHTDREIVEAAFKLKDFGVSLSGAMARVPVEGTPLANLGKIAEERLVRIVAMTRLISGPEVEAICVHPPSLAALRAGANTVVVECGIIPRDNMVPECQWCDFDIKSARHLLRAAGYYVQ